MYTPDPLAPSFHFEIVTPEKTVYSSSERAVLLPGDEGDMTILARHTPMVIALRAGLIAIFRDEKTQPEEFFISGGFVDINTEHCIVLAPQAVAVQALDAATLTDQLTRLRVDLEATEDAAQRKILSDKIALFNMQLAIAER
jgi:F-type H+-transporting ATPase subunit epsilon